MALLKFGRYWHWNDEGKPFRRYRVRRKNGRWHLYTRARGDLEWKFINYYDTHAEALEKAIRYADYHASVWNYFRNKNP